MEDNPDDNNCFMIDTVPCEESSTRSAFMEEGSVLDSTKIVSHLHVTSPTTTDRPKRNLCFNCMGQHSLIDCTEPRNNRSIARNRNNFRNNKRDNVRLHEQQKEENSYVPGRLSNELREALGIGSRDLPEWIFRMRKKGFIAGYPPAYLKQATEKSVLPFVTGENGAQDETDKIIDSQKLFAYPGFNVYVRNLRDPEYFRIPPWKEFVRMHQHVLNKQNLLKRENHGKLENKKIKRKRLLNNSIEEGEIIDDDDEDSTFYATAEEGAILSTLNDETSTPKAKRSKNKDEESSVIVTKGTPILLNKSISSNQYNHEVKKPSLESFAKDIVPFRHENITEERGFFSKMLDIVKSIRRKV